LSELQFDALVTVTILMTSAIRLLGPDLRGLFAERPAVVASKLHRSVRLAVRRFRSSGVDYGKYDVSAYRIRSVIARCFTLHLSIIGYFA
jgi:hypothetical protein